MWNFVFGLCLGAAFAAAGMLAAVRNESVREAIGIGGPPPAAMACPRQPAPVCPPAPAAAPAGVPAAENRLLFDGQRLGTRPPPP